MTFAILGAGAWGKAFGQILNDGGHRVKYWSAAVDELNAPQADGFLCDADILRAVKDADVIVVALPCAAVKSVMECLKGADLSGKSFVTLSKGICGERMEFADEIIVGVLGVDPQQVCILTGPNLAGEVAQRLPAAAILAGQDSNLVSDLAGKISTEYFAVHSSHDMSGARICGVYKNVLAIAIGVAAGANLGNNFCAALTVAGLNEMKSFGAAFGAKNETFDGVAGLGDLLTTAYSNESRNRSFGQIIAETGSIAAAVEQSHNTVEGRSSVESILTLATQKNLQVPIADLVGKLLREEISLEEFLQKLPDVVL